MNPKNSQYHLLISSSRNPSRTVRTLMRDLHTVLPRSRRINRGKLSLEDLASFALEIGARYVMLVNRWKGGPGKLEFYEPTPRGLKLLPPLIYLRGVRLQRQYPVMWRKLRIRPRKLFTVKPLGEDATRIAEALSVFFGSQGWVEAPESPEKGLIYLEVLEAEGSFRITFYSSINGEPQEIGPSIKLRHVIWSVEKPAGGS